MDLIWLIPILPGLGAAINGLSAFARSTGRRPALRGVRDDGRRARRVALRVLADAGPAAGGARSRRERSATGFRRFRSRPRTASARSKCRGHSASIRSPG